MVGAFQHVRRANVSRGAATMMSTTSDHGSRSGRAPVALALIGAGRIARVHARNLRSPEVTVVGVADPDREAADHLAGLLGTTPYTRWEDLLATGGVDAVMVCSASDAHAEQVAAAASSGKHVLCEKPLATDLAGVDSALAAVERSGVVLHVGFNRRFDPGFADLARTVAEGGIGRLLQLRITSRDPEPPPAGYPRGPGGLFADMVIHDFDVARYVSGEEVVAVSAAGSSLVDPLAGAAGDLDVAVVTLRFASGAIGMIECCRVSTYGYDQRVEVHGTGATAWTTNPHPTTSVIADGGGARSSPLFRFFPERYERAYAAELAAFLAACRGEDAGPAATGRDARAALVLAEAARLSVLDGRTVPLVEVDPRVAEPLGDRP